MIKRMIVVFLSVAFCILNCSPILAVEQKNKFEEWTDQIFNNNYEYDYKNLGFEVAEIFQSFNIALSRIQDYGTIAD